MYVHTEFDFFQSVGAKTNIIKGTQNKAKRLSGEVSFFSPINSRPIQKENRNEVMLFASPKIKGEIICAFIDYRCCINSCKVKLLNLSN
jgi:hypothetical protein